ncbi:hypothetical protein [Streptomyces sp. NPDC045251]|uniref:hypothetical protein n=1 Tax=unclassified Streptomyces TaxID=2593676 RepID=UPI0033D38C77
MRRFGLTAAIAVITVVSLASCGAGNDTEGAATPAPATSSASASASPAGHTSDSADKTLQQVENDLRFATEPHGDLHMQQRREGFCIVHGTVPTLKVLDGTALEGIVERMQTRGWTPEGPVESFDNEPAGNMSMTYVESGKYRVLLGTAPVPPEVKEAYAPNQGTIAVSASWPCRKN